MSETDDLIFPSSRDCEVWEDGYDDIYLIVGQELYGYSLVSLLTGEFDAISKDVLDTDENSSCKRIM